jgi:hypothetical protein
MKVIRPQEPGASMADASGRSCAAAAAVMALMGAFF